LNAPIKDAKVEFNNGLGFFPVSLFIDFYPDNSVNLNDLYNTITSFNNVQDIIFRENVSNNLETLSWVTPKLISEGYYISLFSNNFVDVNYNRLITTITHPNQFRKNIKFISVLTQNDIIILDFDDPNFVILTKKLLLKYEIKSKILFNSVKISVSEILNLKIYDMYPLEKEE